MANIFSLTSHVVYGHVGGQACVPAWHLMGHQVQHLPTVLFSNHPGHGGYGGGPVEIERQNQLLDGLIERGFLGDCAAVHTGYLGQAESVDVALRALDAAPDALVVCDPVLGDEGSLYVGEDLARAVRQRLLPRAGLATPNLFELAWLSGREINGLDDAVAAAQGLAPEIVVCTSAARRGEWLHNLAVCKEGVFQVRVPLVADVGKVPKGTGDAFAAILLGHYLNHGDIAAALAWASSALHGLIAASIAAGSDELAIVAAQAEVMAPSQTFEVERLA
ncbi:MAG: pyridoxal kinase [Alphaproteobacteria bacterium]|jgi:pyridoxine kinase|nr:pyridoxal kinase [Alphaproteobacteria bacterium]